MDPRPAGEPEPSEDGRTRADRELRTAVLVAIPALVVGQVCLLLGWWPVAVLLALGGTVTALVLARRWAAMSAEP